MHAYNVQADKEITRTLYTNSHLVLLYIIGTALALSVE